MQRLRIKICSKLSFATFKFYTEFEGHFEKIEPKREIGKKRGE